LSWPVLSHYWNRYREGLILYPDFVSCVPAVFGILIVPDKQKSIADRNLVE
jgi:hypothetical protein